MNEPDTSEPAAAPPSTPPEAAPPAAATPTRAPIVPATPFDLWLAMAAGFAVLSTTNLAVSAFTIPQHSPALAAMRIFWDLALTTSVGAGWGALIALGLWLARKATTRRANLVAFVVHGIVLTAIIHVAWQPSLERQADLMVSEKLARPLEVLLHVATGFGLALALAAGSLSARRWWLMWPAIVIGIVAGGVNAYVFRDDLFDSHCVGGAATALFLAGALRAKLVVFLSKRVVLRRLVTALAALSLVTLVVPPSNRARLEDFRTPDALGAWIHASTVWRLPDIPTDLPPVVDGAWIASREGLAPRPPSAEHLVDGAPIVVFVTIDATRGDLIEDDANDPKWPSFAELKRTSAYFSSARSAGSQTAVSLTTVFSGRYYSELAWTKHGEGASRFDYAADDPAPRVPAILGQAGVLTEKFGAIRFLANEFGVAGGFAEETMAVNDRRHAYAPEVVDPLIARLDRAGPEPLFLYAHLMEPHAPYDRGKVRTGPPIDRYESEITEADKSIGKIIRASNAPRLQGRVVLVVSSDHGEAFGEHDTKEHSKTLYDELLHVPLFIRAAHVVPRRIAEPVGLVDLGATFLDIFGLDTPPTFMGESLVPLAAGRDVTLDRPLFAEGRQRRALVAGDIKVIVDLRRKVIEAFDIAHDPRELKNLFDSDRKRAMPALSTLVRFFQAHQSPRMPGMPVYKP